MSAPEERTRPGRRGLALRCAAAAAGAVAATTLSCPPFGWHLLQWVALVPLFAALDGLGKRQAFLVGWAAGAAVNLSLFSWLATSTAQFGDVHPALAGAAFFGFALASGLQYGLLALVDWRLRRRYGRLRWALLPAAFVAVEAIWPRVFPWTVGTPQVQASLVAQSLDLGGTLLLSALVVLVNAALWALLRARRRGEPLPWAPPLVAALALGGALGYGALRRAEVRAAQEAAPRARLGWVQPNAVRNHVTGTGPRTVMEALERGARAVRSAGAPLVVYPEGVFPWNVIDPVRVEPGAAQALIEAATKERARLGQALTRLARAADAPVLVGAPRHEVTLEGAQPRVVAKENALVLARAGGWALPYSKQHLLPLGEYLPGEATLPWVRRLAPFAGQFRPGAGPRVLEVAGLRLAPLICYEAVWGDEVRELCARDEPELLVNVTNDFWFGADQGPRLHALIVWQRALETRRAMLRVATTGLTLTCLPDGERVVHAELGTEGAGVAELPRLSLPPTLYLRLGEWVAVVAAGLTLAALATARRGPS